MGSSNGPDKSTVLLKELVATLDSETLAKILQEIARGKELDVARAMLEQINKK